MKKNTLNLFLLIGIMFFLMSSDVMAANFSMARIRYDRMKAATPSSLQITIVPATAGTEDKIRLVFGAGVVVGAGQSVSVTNIPVGTTALPGSFTAVGAGTSIVVSGLTDLNVGSTYAFNIAISGTGLGVTTPSAGTTTDSVLTLLSGGAVLDSASVASRFISDDQVVITANVPPTFTFVLSGNTDAFTTDLSSGAVAKTLGIGLSITTNAAKGWTGWIKSANAGLSSVTTTESIGTSGTLNGTPEACVVATDCYVLSVGVTSGTGTGAATADAEYAGNGTTTGGTFSTLYQPFASRTGKSNGDVIWFKALATMIATKGAGSDYTDTWTIVGAGNF